MCCADIPVVMKFNIEIELDWIELGDEPKIRWDCPGWEPKP